jgi:predicted NBD/HSP70 family sugar kinase
MLAQRASADLGAVRRHNLGLLLRELRKMPGLSRAELALRTGMTKATASRLVDELLARGLVQWVPESSLSPHVRKKGRPALPLKLSDATICAMGLEVDVDHLGICLVDLRGETRHEVVLARDNTRGTPRTTLQALAKLGNAGLAQARTRGLDVMAAVLSLPGLVDARRGQLYVAPNLGWRDVPVTQLFTAAMPTFGAHLSIENEANAAAMTEQRKLGDAGRNFVYVTLGVGVGAGVVMDGAIFRGARGFGGELGHTTIVPDGPPCRCGNRGCLEALVGREALARLARHELGRAVRHATTDDALLQALGALGAERHRGALDVLAQVGRWLGAGLAAYANLFDPELIVLGGYGSELAPYLIAPITAHLERNVLGAAWAPIEVRAARAANNAQRLGAAFAAIESVFEDPTLEPIAL